jgi:hypothetical protein
MPDNISSNFRFSFLCEFNFYSSYPPPNLADINRLVPGVEMDLGVLKSKSLFPKGIRFIPIYFSYFGGAE